MISKIERVIYHPLLGYTPIFLIAIILTWKLIQFSPINCMSDSWSNQCIVYENNSSLIYHPVNILILIFFSYNFLYLYYNIALRKNVVGRSVKTTYNKILNTHQIKSNSKRLSILLFCYTMALILSYTRFFKTLGRMVY